MVVQIGSGKALIPGIYRKLGYAVQIGSNGAIKVKQGDWLSKYSMAIHGNPWRVHEYGRRDKLSGEVKLITNVDLIHTGEIIYHIPSVNEARIIGIVLKSDPSKEEQRRLLVDFVKRTKNLSPQHGEMFKSISDTVGFVDNVATLLSVADDLGSLPAAVGTVGTVTGAVGLVLMPIGFMYKIANAVSAGTRKFKKEAMAAAVAAWAFDQPKPPVPEIRLKWVSDMDPADVPRYRKAWKEGVDEIYLEMPKYAIRRTKPRVIPPGGKLPDPVLSHKLLLRAIAKNDQGKLRELVLKQLTEK
jgi:hypothetical protein